MEPTLTIPFDRVSGKGDVDEARKRFITAIESNLLVELALGGCSKIDTPNSCVEMLP